MKENLMLGIQTSIDPYEFSLFSNEQILSSVKRNKKDVRNGEILNIISRLLDQYKLTNLSKIFVVVGEGSFTATRIGVAIANTIAYGLDISIVEITNRELNKMSIFEYTKLKKEFPEKVLAVPIYSDKKIIT
jgi:tRNA A37 threonylcarbamoyladenosine modification protein TsaB